MCLTKFFATILKYFVKENKLAEIKKQSTANNNYDIDINSKFLLSNSFTFNLHHNISLVAHK